MTNRTYSYWEKLAKVDQRKVSPTPLPKRTDVAIVGAGFCGAWLAYFLKRTHPNLEITIVERDFLNLGASVRNAGFLSAGNVSEWFDDAAELAWPELVCTLDARFGGVEIIREEFPELTSNRCGSVDFDSLTGEKENFLRRLNDACQGLGRESYFSVRSWNLGGEVRSVAFNHFDGEVDPCRLLLALHARLESLGVKWVWQTEVNSLGNGRLEAGGATLAYSRAYLCTNAFASGLHSQSTVRPARGQIIVLGPVETPTAPCLGYFRAGYDYFRFIGPRLLVGGGRLEFKEQENTESFAVTEGIAEYLRRLAIRIVGHDRFQVEHHWSGIMGLRQGKHASISDILRSVTIDSTTEAIAGFGGWGVTLTPFVARAIVREHWR